MSALAAVNRLLDLGMLRGRVLVLGPDAAVAAQELTEAGVNGVTSGGGEFDAVVDGGEFAGSAKKNRRPLLDRLGSYLRPLGTLFVAGGRGRLSPADVRAAVPADDYRQHPAVNFGGGKGKGVIVPVQRVTEPRAVTAGFESVAATVAFAPAATAGPSTVVQKQFVIPPAPIEAVQKCDSWCWAACLQMLCRSQGFDVPQETFVTRVFGVGRNGRPPCVMSGPMANLKAALDGTTGEVDGRTVRLTSTAHLGVPQGGLVRQQVRALEDQRPYIMGYAAHAYVVYGATWRERVDGTGPIQITRLELIDPFPTRERLTWIDFTQVPLVVLQARFHGLLLLDVTRE